MRELQLEEVLDYVAKGERDAAIKSMIKAAPNGGELLRQARDLYEALSDIGDDTRPEEDAESASPPASLSAPLRSMGPFRGDFDAPRQIAKVPLHDIVSGPPIREEDPGLLGVQSYARRSMRERADLGVLRIQHGQLLHSPPLRVRARSDAPPSQRKIKSESKSNFLQRSSKKKEPYWNRLPAKTIEDLGSELSITFEMQVVQKPVLSFSVVELPMRVPARDRKSVV